MRSENYEEGTGRLLEVVELTRPAAGPVRYTREDPPGTLVEDRDATGQEVAILEDDEIVERRSILRKRAQALGSRGSANLSAVERDDLLDILVELLGNG